jgi:hypothetical protein
MDGSYRPITETLVAFCLFVVACCVLVVVTAGCSGNSGHRTSDPANSTRVRGMLVVAPDDARAHEEKWIEDAVEAHLVVVDKHRGGVGRWDFLKLVVHRTYSDAVSAEVAHFGGSGNAVWPYVPPNTAWGRDMPYAWWEGKNTLHVVGGSRSQFPGLSHILWHVVENYGPNDHSDSRLLRVDLDCLVAGNVLWSSR